MIRLFEFRDLDRIMEMWLEGNQQAHSFIPAEYWEKNLDAVRAVLPNAEVYVYEEKGIIRGFIGIDADYIAGLFVSSEYRGCGIGCQLIAFAKQKKDRLSLHVYEKNARAVAFYEKAGFMIEQNVVEKESGECELRMVYQKKGQVLL